MKFAVVGSGISGLSMALILSQDHEVILYEVDDRFGGHSNTIEVNYNDKKISVDTGFIVFNKLNYPNLVKLFKFLSVNYQDSDMSLSIDHQKNNIEWSGQDIKTIFAKKKYLGNLKFLFAVLQILIFNFHVKYILNYKNIENILKDFDIADVWGVRKQLSKLYIKNGIDNAYKLKNISNTWVKKSTNVLGAKTVMELRGISCIDLETEETRRKSCCVSRSFGKKVESLDKLKESITTHCLNASEKIRTDKQTTRAVTIFIRTSPFDKNRKYYSNSITIELPVATNNSIELVKTAITGLGKIYKYGCFYQKAGVILSKLRDASEKELNLLAPILENKSQPLMRAIDFTNAKYGRNAISIAQAGISNDWKMRREHSSRIDTASFDFLPKINI